ncbi:MAG: 4Fe-4S binding protein [Desulfobacterales bacterium]|nr:4Fe-4S binding protein [Desulfobacterales bacterium]
MVVDVGKCIGCGFCVRDCPVDAVRIVKKKARIDPRCCTHCGVCARVCEHGAVTAEAVRPEAALACDHCPITCWVPPGSIGACHRYRNQDGRLVRTTPLQPFADVREIVGPEPRPEIRRPVVTAIGAGTTYPCCQPAPQIVQERRGDVDVVTVVTEVPLSYSSVIVKVDTDIPIGKEGAAVYVGKRAVGMVETEQYGSKMLHIGGVNRLTGPNGFAVARAITDIANRKAVKLRIQNGSRLLVQVGKAPVVDGREVAKMRVGCGSATLGIFAPLLKDAADEVVVLDAHITGLLSRHVAGKFVGVRPTGVALKFKQSTPGRYFGDRGGGWGGTAITHPVDVIDHIDMSVGWPGMTVLITETTGQNGALFEVDAGGGLRPLALTAKARSALAAIAEACEPSRVSAVYSAGSGGSARAGVTRYPIKLTQAVHAGKAHLTIGGASGFIWPGGGISFLVDVERVKPGSFYWTPTPATICPLEYTMLVSDYAAMGGHLAAMKPFKAVDPAGGAGEGGEG